MTELVLGSTLRLFTIESILVQPLTCDNAYLLSLHRCGSNILFHIDFGRLRHALNVLTLGQAAYYVLVHPFLG